MTEHLPPTGKRPAAPEIGALNVCAKRCLRCLFGPRPHIPWIPFGKAKAEEALARESHFGCPEWRNVMCRGFYDRHGKKIWYVVAAERLRRIQWIDHSPKGSP